MIELRDAQSIDGCKCRLTRIAKNAHQPPDSGGVTGQWFDTEGWRGHWAEQDCVCFDYEALRYITARCT